MVGGAKLAEVLRGKPRGALAADDHGVTGTAKPTVFGFMLGLGLGVGGVGVGLVAKKRGADRFACRGFGAAVTRNAREVGAALVDRAAWASPLLVLNFASQTDQSGEFEGCVEREREMFVGFHVGLGLGVGGVVCGCVSGGGVEVVLRPLGHALAALGGGADVGAFARAGDPQVQEAGGGLGVARGAAGAGGCFGLVHGVMGCGFCQKRAASRCRS